MPLRLGDSFLMKKPPSIIDHQWVLVTDPQPQTGTAIVVNVTSKQSYSDQTTVLVVGDHPFIIRPSIVYYVDAREMDVAKVELAIKMGAATSHLPYTQTILAKIQAGILSSPETPPSCNTTLPHQRRRKSSIKQ
jgi:hypothetical protein